MKKLPRGYFEFQASDKQTISGRFGTWTSNRFCEKMDIPNMKEMYEVITTGISFRAIAELLLCAVEYTYKNAAFPFTLDHAFDWIDDMGGIAQASAFIGECMAVEEEKKSVKGKK
jgi:hypothetical protein